MPKIFIDTNIWGDEWVWNLNAFYKLLWIYIFTNCDKAGVYKVNLGKMESELGKKIDLNDVKEKFSEKVIFDEKIWIIKTYIKTQYPKLSTFPNSPLHKAVFADIEKNCLNFDLNRLCIDYRYSIDSLQVKVKEKEEVKEKEKEEVKEDTSAKNWRNTYEVYKIEENQAFMSIINDKNFILEMQKFHPGMDILLSLEKSRADFWGNEKGWQHKKKSKSVTIDWVSTYRKALDLSCNKVYPTKRTQQQYGQQQITPQQIQQSLSWRPPEDE